MFDYTCACGRTPELDVLSADRDNQICICGRPLRRLSHFHQVTVQIPKGFHTSKELVMGAPGSKARDEFEQDIRAGKIVPSGKGSRWV